MDIGSGNIFSRLTIFFRIKTLINQISDKKSSEKIEGEKIEGGKRNFQCP